MVRSHIRSRLLWVLPVLVIGIAGCPFSPDKGKDKPPDDDESEYLPQTSITNVLANLKQSYEEKNYVEYIKLLHPSFIYVFDPVDAGQDEIPDQWGLADEKISAENMFGNEPNREGYRAEEIRLSFTAGTPQEDPPINPDWTKVRLSPVNLTIDGRHEETGDVLIYEVLNNQAELYFVQDGQTWYIVWWEDKPLGALAAAN